MQIAAPGYSQLIQPTQDAGAARATPTELAPSMPQTPPAEPAAIYHEGSSAGASDSPFKTGERLYAEMLYTFDEWNESLKLPVGVMSEIGQPSGSLRRAYDAALSLLSPELRAKDWSFSVANERLVIRAGREPLSDEDLAALHAAFQTTGVDRAANAVADVIVTAIEADRYWMYRHLGSGIGSYDVSRDNLADLVDLRRYVEDYREGNRYDPHLRDPTDYDQGYAGGGRQIMEQIAANATQIDVPRRRVFV